MTTTAATTRHAATPIIAALTMLALVFSGLAAITIMQAAPAWGIDPSGGDNAPPDGSGTCAGCTGGGGGGSGWSDYTITSTFANRFNLDKRDYPEPMGFYTTGSRYQTKVGGRWMEDIMKQYYRQHNRPCRTWVDTTVRDVDGNKVHSYALGQVWHQKVHWIYSGGGYRAVDTGYEHEKCIGGTREVKSTRMCPIRVTKVTREGPYGDLPGDVKPQVNNVRQRRSESYDVPLSSKQWTKFGEDYRDGFLNGRSALQRIRRVMDCESLDENDYPAPLPSSLVSKDSQGNYAYQPEAVIVRCSWVRYGFFRQERTHPDSRGRNKRKQIVTWGSRSLADGDAKWLGCTRLEDAGQIQPSYKWISCDPTGVLTGDGEESGFAAAWWGCGEPTIVECYANGDTAPRITITGASQKARQDRAGNNTTVVADGKQVSITWPLPRLVTNGDPVSNYRTVFRRPDGAYAPELTGQGSADPFTANVRLGGATAGQIGDWTTPLRLRFYKAPTAGTNWTPQQVHVTATRYVDALEEQNVYEVRNGRRFLVSTAMVSREVPCPTVHARFWVATTRSAN